MNLQILNLLVLNIYHYLELAICDLGLMVGDFID
jgi:hypothetical protein